MTVSILWAVHYPFWPNRDELLDQGKLVDYSWLAFAAWFFGLALWLWSAWNLLRGFRHQSIRGSWKVVCLTTIVIYVSFVAMYPTNAIDVYIYSARSRLLSHYGQNPNDVRPDVYWDTDPYMRFASREWADNLSPYGPLWNQIAAPVTWLGGDSIGLAVIGFKLLSVVSALAIAWFIHDIVKSSSPEWALVAALAWLWNPLVLWDGVANAHNDVTLMLPVMAALWAWRRGHERWVIPLLVASVLIKYVTVILLPLAIVAVWRRAHNPMRRLVVALWSMGCVLLLIAASMYPFYDLEAVRRSAQEQGAKVNASPAWVVLASLAEWSVADVSAEDVRNAAYLIVAIGIAIWMAVCWTRPQRLALACFEVTFLFMLVASTNQRAWYVIWLVPLAATLLPGKQWRRATLWSVTAMLGHACTIWLWYVWDFDAWGYYWYVIVIVGVVFLPVIALTVWEVAARARSRGDALKANKAPCE
jgi:hypothetical protein